MEIRGGATPPVGPAGGPRACPLTPTDEGPPSHRHPNQEGTPTEGADRTDPVGFKCGSKAIMSGKPPAQACPELALNKRPG